MSNEIEILITSKNESSGGINTAKSSVKGLGVEVDGLKKKHDDADRTSKSYGKGLEAVGEKADASEQRIMGMKDTVDGVATIMKGPGEQGLASYLQGWADLASGIANFVIPAMSSFTIANARAAISTAASKVAMVATSAATKAWAAAQWVLNAALSANPIGLVVIAVAALVAGIIIAYKKSETFREIVQAAAKGAQEAFGWVLDKVKDLWGWMKEKWPTLLAIITGPIGLAVRWVVKHWDKIRDTASDLMGDVKSAFSRAYRYLTDPIRRGVNWAKDKIEEITDKAFAVMGGVRRALGLIWGIITSPVKRAVDWAKGILNGLVPYAADAGRRAGQALADNLRYANVPTFIASKVFGKATGGIIGAATGGARGGRVMVGEHGREIVDLPYGSRVHSNPDTERMLMGGGGGGVLQIEWVGGNAGDEFMTWLKKNIRIRGGSGSNSVQNALGRA